MSVTPEKAGPAKSTASPDPKVVPGVSAGELPWTGERLVPSARGDFVAEHLHRYALASDLASGCDVLDIACGEGYGAAFLAATARSVVGVDNDPDTISHAERKYPVANLKFLTGRAEKIPLPDRSVDLVVSFETLEHLDDHEAMMREIRRVLRPKGRLLISTPDTLPYQEVSGRTNPFHVHELDRAGFESLLARHFKHTAIGLQKSISGSWFVPFKANAASAAEYSGGFRRVERTSPAQGAPYVIALASDGPLAALPASFYNAAQEIAAHYDTLVSEHRDSRAALARMEGEFNDRTEWAHSLEADVVTSRAETARLHDEGVELKNWARTLEGELRKTRALVVERTKLAEKQTAWAQSLEKQLREAEQHFDRVTAELAERTTWAQSLERDLTTERGITAAREREIESRTEWARSLETELAAARQITGDREREIEVRTGWARSLEEELAGARRIIADREHEIEVRTGWARSLETELAAARQIAADQEREIESRTAWAKSLEDNLAESREVVARRDQLLEERTSWVSKLEKDLGQARTEVERLQGVHQEAISWGRSLEAQIASGQKDFARLNDEFADRTRWALSLDAELTATKTDRDRVAREGNDVGRELQEVAAACARLAGSLGALPNGARGPEIADRALRQITHLRLELARKEAELRSVRAAGHEAELNHAAARAENRRLAQSLRDAQVHLDNLLGQTDTLQDSLQGREAARVAEVEAHQLTERELALRTLEARHAGAALSSYERVFACRLFHRWFGHGLPAADAPN
ncbi:MAG TPA: methyltransferase domain-containing protein [Candidatus Didemnitutus sp.]|nr:methyltransferase domain-containing protein [Candidatus Didemnitutus sp.]